jgi:hypothetical protein
MRGTPRLGPVSHLSPDSHPRYVIGRLPHVRVSRAHSSHTPRQPHKYATYGIVPSTAPSSDDESDDTLPRSALNAPIEALQGLANAAAEAAAVPSNSPPRLVRGPI